MKKILKNYLSGICIPAFLFFIQLSVISQDGPAAFPRDTMIAAAREIILASPYCALITLDSTGQSQVRTMNPYPLGDELVIWFATSRTSRKVGEIRNDSRVSVYYADHNNAKGYVTINGKAEVIDDIDLLKKMKREYWETYKIDWLNKFVLIKIIPLTMDVINYKKGVYGDSESNRAPVLVF